MHALPNLLSLSIPRLYALVLCLALLLGVASMGVGFFTDDFLHLATIDGRDTPAHSKWNLFTLADGNPEHMRHQQSTGPHPWFALPELKMHFFRPLTSATMVLDRNLFRDWTPGYHLHSGFWYVAVVASVMLLFRRWLPGGVGVLALLLFTIDEGHAVPLGWWANRNALVAGVFAVLGLVAHVRWREDAWRPGLPLSLLAFTGGLLGGEAALGIMGYVGAYEIAAARGPWRTRILALAPACLLSLVYLHAYGRAGFGAYGSRDYIHPFEETGLFLQHLPDRVLGMVGNLVLNVPLEPTQPQGRLLLGILGMMILAVPLLLLRRRFGAEEWRALRWLLLGGVLAGLPAAGTAASSRLYLLPSIASAAVIALILRHAWAAAWDRRRAFAKVIAILLAVCHLVLAGLFWPAGVFAVSAITGNIERSATDFHDRLDVAGKRVVLLTSPDMLHTIFLPYQLPAEAAPATWWANTLMRYEKRITRTAPNELEVELLDGALLRGGFETALHGPGHGFSTGDVVALDGLRVEVLETAEGGSVTRFRMTFAAPLDDPGYLFLRFDGDLPGFVRTKAPPVGESVVYPREGLPPLFSL